MFRRNKPETSPAQDVKPGGKGRPTPTRKEAEAAAKARAKAQPSRSGRGSSRPARSGSSAQVRAALKGTGDERFLPVRDQGPSRRFLRDLVDQRFTMSELVLPLMVVTLALGYSGVPVLVNASSGILMGTVLVVTYDIFILRRRVLRGLAERFPGESTRGAAWYAVSRLLQLRWFRMPKPKVKVGAQLPEHYR